MMNGSDQGVRSELDSAASSSQYVLLFFLGEVHFIFSPSMSEF